MAYSIFGTNTASQRVIKNQLDTLKATITDKLSKTGGRINGTLTVHTNNVNIARIGNNEDDIRIIFHQNLVMCNKYIKDLHTPSDPQDAATKQYVDRSIKSQKCHVGYIPPLTANINETGFIVSASSEHNANYRASNAFNGKYVSGIHGLDGEWVPTIGTTENFWIMIQCPEQVRVWQTSLRGRDTDTNRIQQWNLEGSNDNTTWTDLLATGTCPLTRICQYFPIHTPHSFKAYRIFCHRAVGGAPGISHWQLYIYNS